MDPIYEGWNSGSEKVRLQLPFGRIPGRRLSNAAWQIRRFVGAYDRVYDVSCPTDQNN